MQFSQEDIRKLADWEPIVEGFEPPSETAWRVAFDAGPDRGQEFKNADYGGRSYLQCSTYSLAEVEAAKKAGRAYTRAPGWQVYLNQFSPFAVLGRGDCLAWCPSDIPDLDADDVIDVTAVADDSAVRLIRTAAAFGYRFLTADNVREVVPDLKKLPFDDRFESPIMLFDLLFHTQLC
jgi:hypothetical protein